MRAHVHVALASIVLAFFAPIVSWALWLTDRRAPPGPWKRRLLGLAILDTVLMLALAGAMALGSDLGTTTRAPPHIGVVLEVRDQGQGAVVEQVVPGSPAAAASIQRGDRIVAVDNVPIERNRELVEKIARTPKSTERHITILRDGQRIERTVAPSASATEPGRSSGSLFEPLEAEDGLVRQSGRRFLAAAAVAELALIGGLVIAARRRRARTRPGLAVLAGLLALGVASSGAVLAFKATIGLSLGALLLAVMAGSLALLVVGLCAMRFVPPEPVSVGPRMSTSRAIVLGVFYALTGSIRVGIFVAMLTAVLGLPITTASEAFALDLSWGPIGIGLFLLATLVLAPIAEETVFRGILLPWLAGWMRAGAALAWSTIVFSFGHLYYGAGVLLIAFYGFLFGWARLRTGKLLAPIALHALLNGTTAAALLASSR